mgnify:CR=1 FL=1
MADESRKQYPPNTAEEIELLWMAAAGSSPATTLPLRCCSNWIYGHWRLLLQYNYDKASLSHLLFRDLPKNIQCIFTFAIQTKNSSFLQNQKELFKSKSNALLEIIVAGQCLWTTTTYYCGIFTTVAKGKEKEANKIPHHRIPFEGNLTRRGGRNMVMEGHWQRLQMDSFFFSFLLFHLVVLGVYLACSPSFEIKFGKKKSKLNWVVDA